MICNSLITYQSHGIKIDGRGRGRELGAGNHVGSRRSLESSGASSKGNIDCIIIHVVHGLKLHFRFTFHDQTPNWAQAASSLSRSRLSSTPASTERLMTSSFPADFEVESDSNASSSPSMVALVLVSTSPASGASDSCSLACSIACISGGASADSLTRDKPWTISRSSASSASPIWRCVHNASAAFAIPRSVPTWRPSGAPTDANPSSNPSCNADSFPAVIPSR